MFAFILACAPDDYVADDTAATDSRTTQDSETHESGTGPGSLVGAWRSEGEDIAELLSGDPINYARIDANFESDGTYVVTATNTDGQSGTFTGAWSADGSTTPGTVILEQATPTIAVAEGIWQVSGTVLTYEVVQTAPDYGYAPPTPASGFGSTSGSGIEAGINVQTYRSRE